MKKLVLIAVNSLLGMTFLLGAMKDESFYMENPSVWVTKKTQTEDGVKVNIKVDKLINPQEPPVLMVGSEKEGDKWGKGRDWGEEGPGFGQGQGWAKGGRWGSKRHGGNKMNLEESKFIGYLPYDSDTSVTFTCTTEQGPVIFRTTLQTLADKGRRGAMLKTVANGSTYALKASAIKVPVAIQIPPLPSNAMVNVNAYVIDFRNFEKLVGK